mgnify:CR=1 FL=1
MGQGKRLLAAALAMALLCFVIHGCDQSRSPSPPAAAVETRLLEQKLDEIVDRLQNVENALEKLEVRLEQIAGDLEDVKMHLDVP